MLPFGCCCRNQRIAFHLASVLKLLPALRVPHQEGGRKLPFTEHPQGARHLLADVPHGWGFSGPCPAQEKEGLYWLGQYYEAKVTVGGWLDFITLGGLPAPALHPTSLQAMWAAPGAGVQGQPGPGLVTVSFSAWSRPGSGSGRKWSGGSHPPGWTCWVDCETAEVGTPGAGTAQSCPHWLSCCQAHAACPGPGGQTRQQDPQ